MALPRVSAIVFIASLAAATQVDAFFIDEHQSPQVSEWDYNDQVAWARQHRECAARAQSPIDIQHKNVIISQHLRIHFYNYNRQLRFKLSNAHHTIKMSPQGSGYEQSGENERGHSYNASSIQDIMTADEYVEFATDRPKLAGQQQQQQQQLQLHSQGRHNKERLVGLPDEPTGATGRLGKHLGEKKIGRQPPPTDQRDHTDNSVEREMSPRLPYEGAPIIKLDWLDDGNNEYKLRDIHFHWAERRDNGSEHAIDGRRAAMEMHLVHIKRDLDKSKIGFTSDSVAVVAIMIESHRKSNADFNPIVNALARINATEQAQLIEYKSIYDLLPSNLDAFYTYSGSLTTPPCYQVVNWIVMAERLNMNAKQIEMFRNLYAPPHDDERSDQGGDERNLSLKSHSDSEGAQEEPAAHGSSGEHLDARHQQAKLIMPNVRTLQPLNKRTILASFTKQGGRLKAALNHSNSIHRMAGLEALSNVVYVLCLLVSIISMSSSNHMQSSCSFSEYCTKT